ncbi:MAG: TonB-dependent receptor plug domain-containing protein, partial [Candidatus Goldbacteria bacterium]|nr:TonB-dependent receptor plug domain-containing protein [Candidatus Goldiibacteriota bacterium]
MKRFIFIGLIFALIFIIIPMEICIAQNTEKWFDIPGREFLSQEQEIKKETTGKKVDIGDIVITARNIPELISIVPRDVQIIKTENEKLYGEDKIKDIIDNLPGIFINERGANDSLATIYLRGTGTKYTLLLLDGIPLNDFMTGGVDLSKISNLNIDKIEVIKRGMSSIYGTDAASGVINIITGDEKKYYLKASGIYGTADLKKYFISSNAKIFNVDYVIGYTEEKKGDYFPNSDVDKKSANIKVSFSNKGLINAILTGYYFKRKMGIPFSDFGPSIARQYDEDFSLGITDVINLDFVILKINGFLRSSDLIYDNPDIYYPIYSRHIKKEYQASLLGIYEEGNWLSLLAGLEWNLKNLDSTDIGKKDIT